MQRLRPLLWLSGFYSVFILLWLLLRLSFSDRLWWVALLNYVAIYLFIPLPILVVASVWNRRWQALTALSIPIVVFTLLYGTLFVPSLTLQKGTLLTVMSFNVMFGNENAAALARTIRALNPDIIGIQEVTPELARALAPELAAAYPHTTLSAIASDPPGADAVGILSKFPIDAATRFDLPGQRSAINPKTKVESISPGSRMGMLAVLRVNGKRLRVVSADLDYNPTFRSPLNQWAVVATQHYRDKVDEIKILNRQLRQASEPFLLLCDCNMADTSEAYAQLSTFARDSFRAVGWGLGHTIPVNLGVVSVPAGQRVDYIWHSDDFTAQAAIVGSDAGSSDHLPLIAKLQLANL